MIKVGLLTDLPLALGFGISNPGQLASLNEEGDAKIIGSAIVRLVEEGGTKEEIKPGGPDYAAAAPQRSGPSQAFLSSP